jgi:hypothetical protein
LGVLGLACLLVRGLPDHLTSIGKGLLKGAAQPQGCCLAFDFALQATHDRALTLDCPAHALELAGVRIAGCPKPKARTFLGIGLHKLNALRLGSFDQLAARRLQHLAVGRIRDRFFLYRGVDDQRSQMRHIDEPQVNRHIDSARHQLVHARLAQQLRIATKQPQFTRPTVLEILQPRQVLRCRRLGPGLDHPFIALIEGVLQVQQRHHQAHRKAPPTQLGHARAHVPGNRCAIAASISCHGMRLASTASKWCRSIV